MNSFVNLSSSWVSRYILLDLGAYVGLVSILWSQGFLSGNRAAASSENTLKYSWYSLGTASFSGFFSFFTSYLILNSVAWCIAFMYRQTCCRCFLSMTGSPRRTSHSTSFFFPRRAIIRLENVDSLHWILPVAQSTSGLASLSHGHPKITFWRPSPVTNRHILCVHPFTESGRVVVNLIVPFLFSVPSTL